MDTELRAELLSLRALLLLTLGEVANPLRSSRRKPGPRLFRRKLGALG